MSPDDISAAKRAGGHCLYFTTNGVPLRQQWESTGDELRLIRIFRQLGVRMMHLTYNRRNPIGDGAGDGVGAGVCGWATGPWPPGAGAGTGNDRLGSPPGCRRARAWISSRRAT